MMCAAKTRVFSNLFLPSRKIHLSDITKHVGQISPKICSLYRDKEVFVLERICLGNHFSSRILFLITNIYL